MTSNLIRLRYSGLPEFVSRNLGTLFTLAGDRHFAPPECMADERPNRSQVVLICVVVRRNLTARNSTNLTALYKCTHMLRIIHFFNCPALPTFSLVLCCQLPVVVALLCSSECMGNMVRLMRIRPKLVWVPHIVVEGDYDHTLLPSTATVRGFLCPLLPRHNIAAFQMYKPIWRLCWCVSKESRSPKAHQQQLTGLNCLSLTPASRNTAAVCRSML